MDNGATSWPKTRTSIERMVAFLKDDCSNINRTYGNAAEKDEDILLDLRMRLCDIFHHDHPETVILNAGITESINTVVKGFFTERDHVITTSVEHNAVLRALTDSNIDFSMIPTDERGKSDYSNLTSLLKSNTKALIVTAGSNVTGFLEDLEVLSEFAKSNKLYFMVDTAQVSPFHEIDMHSLKIDALFFAGHKLFLAPEGTGGMLLSPEIAAKCRPLISGGTGSYSDVLSMPEVLPDKFEAGTRNLPGLMGLYGSVLEIQENFERMEFSYKNKVSYLRENLRDVNGVVLYGPGKDEESTGVISITIPGLDPSRVAEMLKDGWGIEVRVGLHCASTAHKALGTYPEGTIRLTPGVFTSYNEIDTTIEAIKKIIDTKGNI